MQTKVRANHMAADVIHVMRFVSYIDVLELLRKSLFKEDDVAVQ